MGWERERKDERHMCLNSRDQTRIRGEKWVGALSDPCCIVCMHIIYLSLTGVPPVHVTYHLPMISHVISRSWNRQFFTLYIQAVSHATEWPHWL